ncbi:amylo-alpha-1,6-glucosidase [Halobacillus salinarum]|uniref:Amylo-alpha-1,6-glucosidase n=1 Tax=Halobacillus salinarum TaxID=2932257 RepID=A0ABY4EK26_9BACI|nr:amylo-alpha-1,6-glucosidase [Halobacillus salinarum]UOQ44828.1 amylo-alpha-1,6-glucosidase [Halobacillus salinarum]
MDYSVIKEGDLFFTTEKNGDLHADDKGYGLYTQDTRFLSTFTVTVNGEKPELLSSRDDQNYTASIRLAATVQDEGATELLRERYIYDGVLYERLSVTNYFLQKRTADVAVELDADFQDMFIVRNFQSGEVGEKTGCTYQTHAFQAGYQSKDGVVKETVVEWDREAVLANEQEGIRFTLELGPQETKTITFTITPVIDGEKSPALPFDDGLALVQASYEKWLEKGTRIDSDLPLLNDVYQRGAVDTRMLLTDIGFGSLPVAGVPWFSVPFGRDSLLTSLFMLAYQPECVKGTLRTLAHYQGKEVVPEREEQPGKIMHELRFGELAATGQIPFSPYYGTVDATPLFVITACEYYKWTGDLAFIEELKPALEKAINWIDRYGSVKGDGFVQYQPSSDNSFVNQGWKDSDNSNVHEDGTLAKGAIALAEVQGYVYQAKYSLAAIYRKLGEKKRADELESEAGELREAFEQAFWMEEKKFYALALDGEGKQVKALTSNPGHVLMAGLLEPRRAKSIVNKLLDKDLFSGYGIRTMAENATGYYPMSYHNGSVWPHDNALILLGLTKSGFSSQAMKVVEGQLAAARQFEHYRLPELFCGYDSKLGHLVSYPTTCSPQAWAAASSFVWIQAMVGIEPDALTGEITLNPVFPEGMTWLKIEGMAAGNGKVSLLVTKEAQGFKVEILDNTTGWTIKEKQMVH